MTILSEQYKTIASIYDELNADAIDQLSVNLISCLLYTSDAADE